MRKLPLADRLLLRLKTLGVANRKAKEIATGLAPTAARQKVSGTVTGKLEAKLLKLGLSERKAKELAKGLAPTVRAHIKAQVKKKAITLDDVTDDMVNDSVEDGIDGVDDKELDKIAPRVNGHRVRLDLPTAPMEGTTGIQLLRVMDGLTTSNTYLVAAVKSKEGIVAVRQFNEDLYKVKFYPTMAFWEKNERDLYSIGAQSGSYLAREWYQRVMIDKRGLDQLLRRLEAEAKPKSRMKQLIDRFRTVTSAPLIKAFDYLHKRVKVAA